MNKEEYLFQIVVILEICYSRYYYIHFISNVLTIEINEITIARQKHDGATDDDVVIVDDDDDDDYDGDELFYGMSRDHCRRFSPSQISTTLRAGFEHAQN